MPQHATTRQHAHHYINDVFPLGQVCRGMTHLLGVSQVLSHFWVCPHIVGLLFLCPQYLQHGVALLSHWVALLACWEALMAPLEAWLACRVGGLLRGVAGLANWEALVRGGVAWLTQGVALHRTQRKGVRLVRSRLGCQHHNRRACCGSCIASSS